LPIISTNPALFTWKLTTLAASRIELIRLDNSPEEYLKDFWLSIINSPNV
jgi:hypothetical protein